MEKICEKMIFKPAYRYVDDAVVHGMMSKFNPSDRILKAGTQLHPACSPLKHDLRMLQDVAVYRLDKIKKLTGLDLREFDHAIIFKIALMVKKYLAANPTKF